jgi:hypothetical protein
MPLFVNFSHESIFLKSPLSGEKYSSIAGYGKRIARLWRDTIRRSQAADHLSL